MKLTEARLPPPAFLFIYCAAGCDRTRLSFQFTKGPGQIVPFCHFDEECLCHAVTFDTFYLNSDAGYAVPPLTLLGAPVNIGEAGTLLN